MAAALRAPLTGRFLARAIGSLLNGTIPRGALDGALAADCFSAHSNTDRSRSRPAAPPARAEEGAHARSIQSPDVLGPFSPPCVPRHLRGARGGRALEAQAGWVASGGGAEWPFGSRAFAARVPNKEGEFPSGSSPEPSPRVEDEKTLEQPSTASSRPRVPLPSPPASRGWQSRLEAVGWAPSDVLTLPNALSFARLLSGPAIAVWITQGRWPLAAAALALSASTDWLDGQLARRTASHSVLGSYLDPLADKALVCSVVGALGYTGALSPALVALVLSRDAMLVGGAFVLRAHSLGWKWPGFLQFFRVGGMAPSTAAKDASDQTLAPTAQLVQPLLVSKVNTGLQLLLLGAAMLGAWQGWPPASVVDALAAATAVTTVWSAVAYLRIALGAMKRGGGKA